MIAGIIYLACLVWVFALLADTVRTKSAVDGPVLNWPLLVMTACGAVLAVQSL